MEDRGQRLAHALEQRRIGKLYVLALEIGVNESALSRWKKGDSISAGNAMRLCTALDISLDWFLLGRGTMNLHKSTPLPPEEEQVLMRLRAMPRDVLQNLVGFLDAVSGARGI